MNKHNNEVLPSISEADYRALLQLAVTEISTARRLVAQQNYRADTKLRQAVAVLPWGHNLLLLDKISAPESVAFYAKDALQTLVLNEINASQQDDE